MTVLKRTLNPVLGRSLHAREARLAYLLILPTSLIIAGLVFYPVLYNVWLSFHQVTTGNLGEAAPFARLENYRHVLKDVTRFLPALRTTFVYSIVGMFLSLVTGLVASLLLNARFRGRGIARGIMLFPYAAPTIAMAQIFKWILQPNGLVNWVLMEANIIAEPRAWLTEKGLALPAVLLFQTWKYFPFCMLMILARLQAIDQALYEAAEVDGANAWQRFWHITIPELRYVLLTVGLLRLIWNFNKFDDIWLLTGGSSGTMVLPVLTYQYSFGLNNFGWGAANAMILALILTVFMFFYMREVIE